jgi:hypothetical protein
MSGVQQYPCVVCGKGGHSASRCKELAPPPDGFYKPAPGQHHHDDEEDESIINIAELKYAYKLWMHKAIKNKQVSKKLF